MSCCNAFLLAGGLIRVWLKAFGLGDNDLGKLVMDVIIYVVDLAARRFLGDEEVIEYEMPTYRSIVQEASLCVHCCQRFE